MRTPTLYVLMRSDLDSMNPGKAIAQGTHAANHLETGMLRGTWSDPNADAMFREWKGDLGFGRCLCLDPGTPETIERIMSAAEDTPFPADVIVDPSYPVSDGAVTHFVSLLTCGYVFAWEGDVHSGSRFLLSELRKLPLYK